MSDRGRCPWNGLAEEGSHDDLTNWVRHNCRLPTPAIHAAGIALISPAIDLVSFVSDCLIDAPASRGHLTHEHPSLSGLSEGCPDLTLRTTAG